MRSGTEVPVKLDNPISTWTTNARYLPFLCDIEFMAADLTDGVIFLRPLHLGDAVDHLAGEDEEMAKWLSGGRSTLAGVQSYITSSEEHRRLAGLPPLSPHPFLR